MQTIAEVKRLGLGMPVVELRAKIMEVYDRKAGTGDFGPYTFQNILIGDGKDLIKVAVGNKDQISHDAMGSTVLIGSFFSEKKQQWIGAKVAKDAQGNIEIKVSKTGTFAIGNVQEARDEGLEAEIPPIPAPVVAKPEPIAKPTIVNNADLEKYRSMCIAYAKDLVVANIINRVELCNYAEQMVTYIKTGNIDIVKENTISADDEVVNDAQEEIEF
jgi:hypothetical protein